MSVKYWADVAGALESTLRKETATSPRSKADGKKPTGEHIPFEDIKGGYALRIANTTSQPNFF